MCDTCGCGQPPEAVTYRKPGENHHHPDHDHHGHNHDHHDHDHHHHPDQGRTLQVETDILQENNLLAQRNRGWLEAKGILALNLVSSPGSGKTTLLERTITSLKDDFAVSVIEGDQQTLNDADRIAATGAPVIQVNTGKGCHLDARMIRRAMDDLAPAEGSLLMIENVGNLVCPAMFDLGEAAKVVIISVTEGDDKPLKYPTMFAAADLCLINKIDLLPYVEFDVDKCEQAARTVNPRLEFHRLSATTGDGMDSWYAWLKTRLEETR
ncbi:MAG: hydrogenase nickel incorporation protein HypB [Acidobacteria bacterium]|uniref:Hydrogenase nickel incorporation protein HypB n=1 Tax=Candidatus Polarisedimenticola svalbardensis TaxID=2886004 RepID=A0A8J6XW76_9BACT|nr:hydrogenase nickel incorporation protein HypB [Candidatus Polarisedimenticola svalbardensis]